MNHDLIQNDMYFILSNHGKDVLIDDTETKALISYYQGLENSDTLKIITLYPLVRGCLVEYQSSKYLIIGDVPDKRYNSYYRAIMRKCNNILKFQDKDTLEVYEIPCILQNKTSVYSDGVSGNQYFYLADDQILIIVPNNNITGKITKNQRFIFNHDMYSVYEVTKIDKLTNVGLINIVLKNVVYDENRDNLELNLSDYIEPNEDTNEDLQPVDDYRIEISGEDTIVYNWSEIYTATVYDANGKVVDVEVQFEVVGDDSYAWIENQTSNRCTVRAGSQYGVSVVLRAILVDNPDIYTDKEISIVMW